MSTALSVRGTTEKAKKAYQDYCDLGPLTDKDIEYLDAHTGHRARRRVLSNWYGKLGATYAWRVYRYGLGLSRTSPNIIKRAA